MSSNSSLHRDSGNTYVGGGGGGGGGGQGRAGQG